MKTKASHEPAPALADSGFTEIMALAARLHNLHRQQVATLTPIAQNLIRSRSRSSQEIEHILDQLLDVACIPEGLALFKTLCRYYYAINPAATANYVNAYREIWDSEATDEKHAG